MTLPAARPLDGDVRVYALQLRYALTERLALIATKDGYIEFKPEGVLANDHSYGFADLAFGLKYALIDSAEHQLLITPGLTITIPTGNDQVFQGDGGEWNLFVSAVKALTICMSQAIWVSRFRMTSANRRPSALQPAGGLPHLRLLHPVHLFERLHHADGWQ